MCVYKCKSIVCIIKKKCYFGLVAVALFAGVSTYMANRDSEMTDLMRADIEALSADETGDGTTGMGQIYDAKKVRE